MDEGPNNCFNQEHGIIKIIFNAFNKFENQTMNRQGTYSGKIT